jgi:hypothetical protein
MDQDNDKDTGMADSSMADTGMADSSMADTGMADTGMASSRQGVAETGRNGKILGLRANSPDAGEPSQQWCDLFPVRPTALTPLALACRDICLPLPQHKRVHCREPILQVCIRLARAKASQTD